MDAARVETALLKLERWLDTMRCAGGYGGPVAHWWQNCLHFTGAGLDWRYEGIIIGYLSLYRATRSPVWLDKARRAGDDLVRGQLPSGLYRSSSFELNPYAGGTPHEAAADLALLQLAQTLNGAGNDGQVYLDAAKNNLTRYFIDRLWDPGTRSFRDQTDVAGFVPNKAATLSEALIELARATGDGSWADLYAVPALEAICRCQEQQGPLRGAIDQYSLGGKWVKRYFPYYNARCVSGLVAGYRWSGDGRMLDAAMSAMQWILRTRYDDGSFPQVVYCGGRVNRYPQWIAAAGDVLRAVDLLRPAGLDADTSATLAWLLDGQLPSGGFRTAHGFASQISQHRLPALPEFRDILPVVGWNDKAFRYLAEQTAPQHPLDAAPERCAVECTYRGRRGVYVETADGLQLSLKSRTLYHWRKGQPWAETCDPMFWK